MNRGEVWWVNFEPSVGEAQKIRPAVIVSNNSSNRHLNRLQVVPITSNVAKLFAGEAYVVIKGSQRKAQANLLTTVSKLRLTTKTAELSQADIANLEGAIRLQLEL